MILGLFGPTASGKSAIAGALLDRLDAEAVSADSAALYAGLPIVTAAPVYPIRLAGVFPLDHAVSIAACARRWYSATETAWSSGNTPASRIGYTGAAVTIGRPA